MNNMEQYGIKPLSCNVFLFGRKRIGGNDMMHRFCTYSNYQVVVKTILSKC